MPRREKTPTFSRDRISALSDDILHRILSLLPMKQSVLTSILSKRWRHLYKFNTTLDFTSIKNISTITGLLNQHQSTTIHKLVIDFIQNSSIHQNNNIITFAITKGAHKIFLKCLSIPDFLYFHTPLTELGVFFTGFKPPIQFQSFPSLKALELCHALVSDSTVELVLSTCPVLEKLTLQDCYDLLHLEITDPRYPIPSNLPLKTLQVFMCKNLKVLVVDAFNLVSFKYIGYKVIDIRFETTTHLEEAHVIFHDDLDSKRVCEYTTLFKSMGRVNYLSVSSWFSQVLFTEYWVSKNHHITFINLKEFHWCGYLGSQGVFLALATFIGQCPFLKKLRIDAYAESEVGYRYHYLGCPEDIEQALPYHDYWQLRTIEMDGISSTDVEMDLVRFLLRKACFLDSFHLMCYQEDMPKLRKHINHLVKGASKHLNIVLAIKG